MGAIILKFFGRYSSLVQLNASFSNKASGLWIKKVFKVSKVYERIFFDYINILREEDIVQRRIRAGTGIENGLYFFGRYVFAQIISQIVQDIVEDERSPIIVTLLGTVMLFRPL